MHFLAATVFTTLLIAGLALIGAMVRYDGRIMLDALLGRRFVGDGGTNAGSNSCAKERGRAGHTFALRRRPMAGAAVKARCLPQPEWRAAA